MKLKPAKRRVNIEVNNLTTEKPKEKKVNKLPPDGYKPLFAPARFLVREEKSYKDPSKVVKQYLEISVKRFNDDLVNAPYVWITMYQESDFYTGYLKGKTVYFPLEKFQEVMDCLTNISDECEKWHIYDLIEKAEDEDEE